MQHIITKNSRPEGRLKKRKTFCYIFGNEFDRSALWRSNGVCCATPTVCLLRKYAVSCRRRLAARDVSFVLLSRSEGVFRHCGVVSFVLLSRSEGAFRHCGVVSSYFCPETKVPKILRSKGEMARHQYRQKRKSRKVCADLSPSPRRLTSHIWCSANSY